jgi:hypothetical protein
MNLNDGRQSPQSVQKPDKTVWKLPSRRAGWTVWERRPQKLVVSRHLEDFVYLREEATRALVLGGIPALFVSTATESVLSIRHVRSVRHTACHFPDSARRPDAALATSSRDELNMLSNLFSLMLEEAKRLMYEVESACDGIAHDLRTPLIHTNPLLANIRIRAQRLSDEPIFKLVVQAKSPIIERIRKSVARKISKIDFWRF